MDDWYSQADGPTGSSNGGGSGAGMGGSVSNPSLNRGGGGGGGSSGYRGNVDPPHSSGGGARNPSFPPLPPHGPNGTTGATQQQAPTGIFHPQQPGTALKGGGYAGVSTFTPPSSTHSFDTSGLGGGIGGASSGGIGTMAMGAMGAMGGGAGYVDEYANEPPLLEELGINFGHIWAKTLAVVIPGKKLDISYLDDTDLAGPLFFALIFGAALLMRAKVHFGYIYGFGMFGCVGITLVLNLLGDKPIDVWRTCSVLGYSLLPIIALAVLDVPLDMHGKVGLVFAPVAVCWSCFSAVHLFERYLDMRAQRWLVAYPVGLLYACFALITIF